MKYQSVPVPENIFKTINKKGPFTTKIQMDRFNSAVLLPKIIISMIQKMIPKLEVTKWITLKMRVKTNLIVHIN